MNDHEAYIPIGDKRIPVVITHEQRRFDEHFAVRPSSFQQRCRSWLVACLGEDAAGIGAVRERSHRFLEEALELGQAAGATKEDALKLVEYVFSRPVGELSQEIGGTMTTLASLCNATGYYLDACADAELARCWSIIDKIRAKAISKRTDDSLPGVSA